MRFLGGLRKPNLGALRMPGLGRMRMRMELAAALCTLALFMAFGIFLYVDHLRVEQRAVSAALSAQPSAETPAKTAASAAPAPVPAAPAETRADPAAAQHLRAEVASAVAPTSGGAHVSSPVPTNSPANAAATRTSTGTAPAAIAAAASAAAPAPTAAPAAPSPQPAAATPAVAVHEPKEVPVNKAALNDILKAAANGQWVRVDELLLSMSSASTGSSRRSATSELVQRGRAAIENREYEVAIEALNKAINVDPQNAGARNQLAFALLRQGRVEDAHAEVTRSLGLEPYIGATWANAAEILAERDNAVASKAALRVAIHLAQDRKKTLSFLSQADQNVSSAKFRAVIADVMPDVAKIPSVRSGST